MGGRQLLLGHVHRTRTVGYAIEEFNLNPLGVNPTIPAMRELRIRVTTTLQWPTLYASPFCQALAAIAANPPAPVSTCQLAMAIYKPSRPSSLLLWVDR